MTMKRRSDVNEEDNSNRFVLWSLGNALRFSCSKNMTSCIIPSPVHNLYRLLAVIAAQC